MSAVTPPDDLASFRPAADSAVPYERKASMHNPHSLRYVANCSTLFRELPLLARPAAAQANGFDAIEFWWPFDRAVPADRDVTAFVSAVRDSGVALVALNFFAGDIAGPDCGLLSLPEREREFRDSLAVAAAIGETLRVQGFNALYGPRLDGLDESRQDDVAATSLVAAADAVQGFGGTVLIEALSGAKPYALRTARDAATVVDRVKARGRANIGLLCDLYHLASNGEDLDAVIDDFVDLIAHVQIADVPGRGAPGTGTLPIESHLGRLAARGYAGWVGLEYLPSGPTPESLEWLPVEARKSRRKESL